MIVTIHQPQFLPWLGLVDRILRSDVFVILDCVPYSKNYFYNRNRIRSASGSTWLTIPVLTKNRTGQTFREVEINQDEPWGKKHLRSIRQNYLRSPFFEQYMPDIEAMYQKHWAFLLDICVASIHLVAKWLEADARIVLASSLRPTGSKQELLVDICRRLDADRYLSGPDGANYIDMNSWEKSGVAIDFQEYAHPTYDQCFSPFIEKLSVIDLLFNAGPKSKQIITAKQKGYFTRSDGNA